MMMPWKRKKNTDSMHIVPRNYTWWRTRAGRQRVRGDRQTHVLRDNIEPKLVTYARLLCDDLALPPHPLCRPQLLRQSTNSHQPPNTAMTTFYSRRASKIGSYNIQRALPPARPELPTRTWPDWPTRDFGVTSVSLSSLPPHRDTTANGIYFSKNQQLFLLLYYCAQRRSHRRLIAFGTTRRV